MQSIMSQNCTKGYIISRVITVERRVALTLWCFATPGEYGMIAHLFGVARCTVCIIVHDVCRVITDILLPRYIRFASGEDLQRTVDSFHGVRDVPQCAGAFDGSHIPILGPAETILITIIVKGGAQLLFKQ